MQIVLFSSPQVWEAANLGKFPEEVNYEYDPIAKVIKFLTFIYYIY